MFDLFGRKKIVEVVSLLNEANNLCEKYKKQCKKEEAIMCELSETNKSISTLAKFQSSTLEKSVKEIERLEGIIKKLSEPSPPKGDFIVYGPGQYAFKLRNDGILKDVVVVVDGISKSSAKENMRGVAHEVWRIIDIKKMEDKDGSKEVS